MLKKIVNKTNTIATNHTAPAHILPGPQVVIAQIGFPAHLQCNAVGNPDPTVTW